MKQRRCRSLLSSSFSLSNCWLVGVATLLFLQSFSNSPIVLVKAQIACETTLECRLKLKYPGVSVCQDGFCTNPYAQGCLRALQGPDSILANEDQHPIRVCNSDDSKEDMQENTICVPSSYPAYKEVRILPGDWESSIFLAWIMQILLSELLEVPVSIETSLPRSEGSNSFYDFRNGLIYAAVPYNFEALETSVDLGGDCSKAGEGVACGHVLPEVWSGQINAWDQALRDGYIEPPEGNGMVGKFSFMIPSFTAQEDPSLTSLHGLKNRTKMAETFQTPTNWYDYCTLVSTNGCNASDGIAERFPLNGDEYASYFVEGLYKGHFRITDQNNCTKYPDTCYGHVVDPPCDWDTITESQMYWNNISLRSAGPEEPNNGYTYSQMQQVWFAANATRSNVFMWWWKPDGLDELFSKTDYELQPTFLPPPTEECETNRVTNVERCSADPVERVGRPVGACDFPAHSLQKIISASLLPMTFGESEALRSPAYDFIKRFRISDLSAKIMLQTWVSANNDKYGIDPRDAVCEWVYENLDELKKSFVPPGYPRVFEENFSTVMFLASVVCGSLALIMALSAALATFIFQDRHVFRYAHVPFVQWVLAGLILVSIGSILVAFQPTTPLCIAQPYFVSLGYTVELMPLVVKVSAINRLMHESKRMRRVVINTKRLHGIVFGVVFCILVYLISWTIVDPPTLIENNILVDYGESIVRVSTACESDSNIWVLATYAWQGFLLLTSLVLAVQSRNIKQEFNESQSLAFMVYSHTLFLVLRALVYSLPADNFTKSNIQSGSISLCLSLDTVNTLFVYFGPKFYMIARGKDRLTRSAQVTHSSMHAYSTTVDDASRFLTKGDLGELLSEACELLVRVNEIDIDKIKAKNSFSRTDVLKESSQEYALESASGSKTSTKNSAANTKEDSMEFVENEDITREDMVRLREVCRQLGTAQFKWEQAPEEKSSALSYPAVRDEKNMIKVPPGRSRQMISSLSSASGRLDY